MLKLADGGRGIAIPVKGQPSGSWNMCSLVVAVSVTHLVIAKMAGKSLPPFDDIEPMTHLWLIPAVAACPPCAKGFPNPFPVIRGPGTVLSRVRIPVPGYLECAALSLYTASVRIFHSNDLGRITDPVLFRHHRKRPPSRPAVPTSFWKFYVV